MNVSYFEDTDTLYIEFRDSGIAESKDLWDRIKSRGCERWSIKRRGLTLSRYGSERRTKVNL